MVAAVGVADGVSVGVSKIGGEDMFGVLNGVGVAGVLEDETTPSSIGGEVGVETGNTGAVTIGFGGRGLRVAI